MAFFLGIDAGGTKTTCVVGDETSVRGVGSSSGSNIVRLGEARAGEALRQAISRACTAAGIESGQIAVACIGAAGAGRPEIRERLRRILAELLSADLRIAGDMEIALEAAFPSSRGVVVIAGTGSIAYGRNAQDQTARAGGWGFAVSDEGSGHWIGRAAVAAALRAEDQGQHAALLDAVGKLWGKSSQEEIVLAANATPPPDFAALFPVVLSVADHGDVAARGVLSRAGAELSSLAKIVIQRLFPEGSLVPLAMSGGVFASSSLVREVFYNSLRSQCPSATLNDGIVEPVQGALAMARRGQGKP